MEMVYIKLYLDDLEALEPYGDAERGRLFTALLEYAKTGEASHLSGNERFLFPMMKARLDRDREALEKQTTQRSEAGKKGALAKAGKAKQSQATLSKSGNNKDKDNNKDNIPPKSPQGDSLPAVGKEDTGFEPVLQQAFEQWLAYKRERRETYKPTGLQSLVTQIRNAAGEYGAGAVASLIQQSMASGYRGIVFDRLKGQKQGESRPNAIPDYSNTHKEWSL